ncbi:hypothetical protein [Rhodococcus sp. 14C212]|uniref:hypothetical protein n=1 Tax=Rhodococcus sp. 14C212 TaxID=2711209 RepID=UPI00197ECC40|nr:hypothetical protein [Rhodococcus sp. 14C212]
MPVGTPIRQVHSPSLVPRALREVEGGVAAIAAGICVIAAVGVGVLSASALTGIGAGLAVAAGLSFMLGSLAPAGAAPAGARREPARAGSSGFRNRPGGAAAPAARRATVTAFRPHQVSGGRLEGYSHA